MDAHWVNNRPGYRYRHGHTSAKRATAGRTRNLYVREDTILGDLAAALGFTANHDPRSVARYLRTRGITIVCDHNSWSLTSDAPIH
jgi:hypothetical protein